MKAFLKFVGGANIFAAGLLVFLTLVSLAVIGMQRSYTPDPAIVLGIATIVFSVVAGFIMGEMGTRSRHDGARQTMAPVAWARPGRVWNGRLRIGDLLYAGPDLARPHPNGRQRCSSVASVCYLAAGVCAVADRTDPRSDLEGSGIGWGCRTSYFVEAAIIVTRALPVSPAYRLPCASIAM